MTTAPETYVRRKRDRIVTREQIEALNRIVTPYQLETCERGDLAMSSAGGREASTSGPVAGQGTPAMIVVVHLSRQRAKGRRWWQPGWQWSVSGDPRGPRQGWSWTRVGAVCAASAEEVRIRVENKSWRREADRIVADQASQAGGDPASVPVGPAAVEVQAVRWDGSDLEVLDDWADRDRVVHDQGRARLVIRTPDRSVVAGHGDWIVRDANGTLYGVAAEVFPKLYEPAGGNRAP